MTEHLAPELNKISVRYDRLILDPNNPRFTTRKQDQISEDDCLEQDIAGRTMSKMKPELKPERYKIDELVRSIRQNGWLPVDAIFVRKLQNEKDLYVVLEGNRRVAAIRLIMSGSEIDEGLREALTHIEVMEVLDSDSDSGQRRKISYLLGVRHHGSLKKWTPFAQAHNILERYLDESGQTLEDFKWIESYGQKVADTLSITITNVEDRLKVYRAMAQIGNSPAVENSAGGIKDRYYSLCAEPLLSPRKKLADYVKQNRESFLLMDGSVERMTNLCHFDRANRTGAPMHNPSEWRYLDNILADEDVAKREENLRKVQHEKQRPSDAWADRAKELATLTWDKWLSEVNLILTKVTLQELSDTTDAVATVERLVCLVDDLNGHDIQ